MKTVFPHAVQCCGCGRCAALCPQKAIAMRRTGGFSYPVIDPGRCTECGLCRRECAFQRPRAESLPRAAFAARAADDVRLKSASGGAFTALSDLVLAQGGVVYGAAFGAQLRLRHVRARTFAARDRMRGSKYLQSETAAVFATLAKDLRAGRRVLFTGTPCQVHAVRCAALDHENLLTVDLICHGVPSPAVWEAYIAHLERRAGQKPVDFIFRDKQVSWRRYAAAAVFAGGSVRRGRAENAFTDLFCSDLALRPCCTCCPYAAVRRVGDCTIGDFWGIERVFPALDDGLGVSALLINSEKGQALLPALADKIMLRPCTIAQVTACQPNTRSPSPACGKSARFWRDFAEKPFGHVLRKYTDVGFYRRLKTALRRLIRHC